MKERTYSEEEMAAMLKHAANLQARAAKNAHNRPGLTLPELEVIAAESGLDPVHLRQAASELFDSGISASHQNRSTSASHNYVTQWVVAELTEESWEEVESELRHRYDSELAGMMTGARGYGKGTSQIVGRAREWKHMSMSGIETKVIVQPRGESLQIKLSQRVGWGGTTAESVSYGVVLAALAALVSGAIAHSSLLGFAVLAGVMLTAIPLIYIADKAWREKKHKELEELGSRLTDILGQHPPITRREMTYEDTPASSNGESRIDTTVLEQEQPEIEGISSEKSRRRERQLL